MADVKERLLHGLDSADTHHAANNLVWADGYIYYQRGVFHVSNVETLWQGPQRDTASAMYRFNREPSASSVRQQQPEPAWHQLRLLGLSLRH